MHQCQYGIQRCKDILPVVLQLLLYATELSCRIRGGLVLSMGRRIFLRLCMTRFLSYYNEEHETHDKQCQAEHDPAFPDVYYKNNIGQRVTMQSFYMTYGGTSWGHCKCTGHLRTPREADTMIAAAAPVVYTSYDYSAPLRETRQQSNKMYQTKLVNMFAASSPDLLKTYMVGNGTGFRVSDNSAFAWVLKNPDTGATFSMLSAHSRFISLT